MGLGLKVLRKMISPNSLGLENSAVLNFKVKD
jgi:hypothetical protein